MVSALIQLLLILNKKILSFEKRRKENKVFVFVMLVVFGSFLLLDYCLDLHYSKHFIARHVQSICRVYFIHFQFSLKQSGWADKGCHTLFYIYFLFLLIFFLFNFKIYCVCAPLSCVPNDERWLRQWSAALTIENIFIVLFYYVCKSTRQL